MKTARANEIQRQGKKEKEERNKRNVRADEAGASGTCARVRPVKIIKELPPQPRLRRSLRKKREVLRLLKIMRCVRAAVGPASKQLAKNRGKQAEGDEKWRDFREAEFFLTARRLDRADLARAVSHICRPKTRFPRSPDLFGISRRFHEDHVASPIDSFQRDSRQGFPVWENARVCYTRDHFPIKPCRWRGYALPWRHSRP